MFTKTNVKKFLKQAAVVTGLMALGLFLSTTLVSAQGFFGAGGAAGSVPGAVSESTGGTGSLRDLVLTMVNFFLGFLALIAVLMIVYAGVTYVTAAGDTEKVDKAKKVIMYAVVGILIVMLSFAIVNTILGAGLGTENA